MPRTRRGMRLATDEEASAPIVEETPTPVLASNPFGFEPRDFRNLTVNVAGTLLAAVILYGLFGKKLGK